MRRFADENASEQVPDLGQRWARRIIPCSNLDALDALPPFSSCPSLALPLPGIRIRLFPQHQPDRHSRQIEALPQRVDQTAAVAVRHSGWSVPATRVFKMPQLCRYFCTTARRIRLESSMRSAQWSASKSSAAQDLAVVMLSGHGTMIDNRFDPVPAQHVGVLTVGTGLDLDRSLLLTWVERGRLAQHGGEAFGVIEATKPAVALRLPAGDDVVELAPFDLGDVVVKRHAAVNHHG